MREAMAKKFTLVTSDDFMTELFSPSSAGASLDAASGLGLDAFAFEGADRD